MPQSAWKRPLVVAEGVVSTDAGLARLDDAARQEDLVAEDEVVPRAAVEHVVARAADEHVAAEYLRMIDVVAAVLICARVDPLGRSESPTVVWIFWRRGRGRFGSDDLLDDGAVVAEDDVVVRRAAAPVRRAAGTAIVAGGRRFAVDQVATRDQVVATGEG